MLMSRLLLCGFVGVAAMLTGSAGQAIEGAAPADPIRRLARGLVDQNGRAVDAARFGDRFILVNFIFTGCSSTCPTQTAELARFHRALPPAVRAKVSLLSISVDPSNDTPRALKTYAKAFGADARYWTFATGKLADVARITRDFAAYRPGSAATGFHISEVRLFDPRHRMIQRYAGAPLADRQLRADLLTLASAPS